MEAKRVIARVMEDLAERNPHEPEFSQAVLEVME